MSNAGLQEWPSAAEVLSAMDLQGKRYVVTGATAGMGYASVEALLAAGADVWACGRDHARLDAMQEALADSPGRLHTVVMDLSDRQAVAEAGAALAERLPALDGLLNNAGVMACPLQRTPEGYEWQLAVNHIAHFVLTAQLIKPLLTQAARGEARIINIASAGHKFSGLRVDDPHFSQQPYDKWLAYGQSKTANMLFSVSLNQRYAKQGLRSFAVHPGAVVTELARHLTRDDFKAMSGGHTLRYKTPSQGAATGLWALTSTVPMADPEAIYLEECQIGVEVGQAGGDSGYLAYAVDPLQAEQLWTMSQQWTDNAFPEYVEE